MPIDPVTATAVAGAVSSGINAMSQASMNRATRLFNERMYEKQKADNISLWQMQNAYNSPVEQMKRLEQAGLNPNLVYGNGTVANSSSAPSSSNVQSWNPRPVQFDIGEQVGRIAQVNLLKAQAENVRQDSINKAAQTQGIIAGSSKSSLDLDFAQANFVNALRKSEYEMQSAGHKSAIDYETFRQSSKQTEIFEDLGYLEKQLQLDLTRSQLGKIKQEIRKISADAGLSEVEESVAKMLRVDNRSLNTVIQLIRLLLKR